MARRLRPPPGVVLDGERTLAVAPLHSTLEDHHVVIASDRGLYLPNVGGFAPAEAYTRLAWTQIDRVLWEEPILTIQARGDEAARTWRIDLADPLRLPEVVRERVMASIVVTEHIPLHDKGGVRIVGRRDHPGAAIDWSFSFDAGLDPHDGELRRAAEAALAELRNVLGV
jgi:hypothetical protein